MSFGHSFRDFIALGTLAWCVYKSCKGTPEAFGDISLEVLSLHTVLKEAEEAVFAHPLPPDQRERLKAVEDSVELRARLVSNTALLMAWMRYVRA